jgi:exodeoxyribonuclease VII large subunit
LASRLARHALLPLSIGLTAYYARSGLNPARCGSSRIMQNRSHPIPAGAGTTCSPASAKRMIESSERNPDGREIFSPSRLVRLARDVLEDTFPLVWIEGEISNFSKPASGHIYFSLKDAQAQIRCAMFRPKSQYLRFKPADGKRVLARARVSLYEARGEFQLIVEHLEEAGEGALLRAFEQLKAKLAAQGLFDPDRKRAIPILPRRIAVITSPTGAAIRDVLSVLARRFPLVEVDVLPVPVQGKDAPLAIVAALDAASRAQRHDVILLTRGGGSLEDLWAFNDEAVAHAIRASSIPVVSAIGHEIDFTIADFAADLRAPTPSAAAELLVPDGSEILRRLRRERGHIEQLLRRRLQSAAQRLDHAQARLRAQHPKARLAYMRERLASLRSRIKLLRDDGVAPARNRVALAASRLLALSPLFRIQAQLAHTDALRDRLRAISARRFESRRLQLSELARTLNAVSPLATLQRGYSILLNEDRSQVLRSVAQVREHSRLVARLADGEIGLRPDNADITSTGATSRRKRR